MFEVGREKGFIFEQIPIGPYTIVDIKFPDKAQ